MDDPRAEKPGLPGRRSAIAVLSIGLAACSAGPRSPAAGPVGAPAPSAARAEPAPRPDIVLVTIDTLRRDHVSAYGYDRATTPFLDSLAADGVRFERAQSSSSWTVPAVASLLTGLEPAGHGVVSGLVTEQGEVLGQEVLGDGLPFLPEVLREHGYFTAAITANAHLHGDFGYARGFDEFRCLGFATADRVNSAVLEMVGRRGPSVPFFLWVHYFDPHDPYIAGPRFERFLGSDEPIDEAMKGRLQQLGTRIDLDGLLGRNEKRTRAYLAALYDSEIHRVDASLRVLLHDVGGEDALVVITSDHGEEFLDHGNLWHGHTLFEELIAVPLIVRFPGTRFAGAVVRQRVSLVDVLPTVLDFLDIERPLELHGRSLMPLTRGEALPAVPLRASLRRERSLEAVTLDDWKLIRDESTGEDLLLNLAGDAGESSDVGPLRQDQLERMRRLLEREIARRSTDAPRPEIVKLSAERLSRLRSLGYVD